MPINLPDDIEVPDAARIGRRLRQMRELRGLSLSAAAELAGVTKGYLSRLEAGDVENPGMKTLGGVVRVLDGTLADLFAPEADPGDPKRDTPIGEFEQMMADAPEEFRQFAAEQEERDGRPLPLDAVRSLLTLQMRGKKPQTVEDWYFAYFLLSRSIR